jgi:hypothetical protein
VDFSPINSNSLSKVQRLGRLKSFLIKNDILNFNGMAQSNRKI